MTETIKRIEVRSVSKNFKIRRGSRALLNLFFSGDRKPNILKALHDINLEVLGGEVLGIIGKNGSGKSTLLRIIGGLLQSDSGTAVASGKTLYLNGFSQGTDPLLTLRQNIFLVGSIMGLRRNEIRGKIDAIIDFAGLREFLDVEVFKLSSGMITRLDFSIRFHFMQHTNPNILLLDEVLSAAGDIEFQSKSTRMIENLLRGGAAVILVSHDLELIRKYSNRVIWLDKGMIKEQGKADEIISKYKNIHT
ncbi:MAG TPA: ATP-binding cassette domain-containing protein [Candidatus Paceibacterota bacterium]|nr:ATP-binding cassette domain-containing protein [Candidatus Paceibacterota bacterium]